MIAMLIIGGMTSLAGAVVGTLVISAFAEFLRRVRGGVRPRALRALAKPGLREVGLALVMLRILILRPSGVTAGRELVWPFGGGRGSTPTGSRPPGRTCQGRVFCAVGVEARRRHEHPPSRFDRRILVALGGRAGAAAETSRVSATTGRGDRS